MGLHWQSNTFSFSTQSDSDIYLVNSDFNNFLVLIMECNSIETPFNDTYHSVSIDSKYYDISHFSKQKFLICNYAS